MTGAEPHPRRSFGRLVFRSVLGAMIGIIAVLIAVFVLMLIAIQFDSHCGTPGDSGGCEMGVATVSAASALPGAILGLAFGFWRAWRAGHSRG
jgi:hypothetical protein